MTDEMISNRFYHVFPTGTTVCCIELVNGTVIVGDATPADRNQYDEQKGRRLALRKAVQRARPLIEYSMKGGVPSYAADVTLPAEMTIHVNGIPVKLKEPVAAKVAKPHLRLVGGSHD